MNCLELTIDGPITHMKLVRPDALNTMSPAFWRELDAATERLHRARTAADQARVLVISSSGKHFSAGMDLSAFGGAILMDDASPEGRAAIADMLWDMQGALTRLENLRIPTIAVLHGGVIGGAVDMVTACCMRIASADAFFCIQEINIGMVADIGTLQRLPKLVPMGVVKELAYSGRRMGAQRAYEVGLVNEVHATPELALQAALALAQEIAAKPPVSIWGTKQALHYARDHSTADALQHMGTLQAAIWSNAHVREAVTAMRDKRAGQFDPLAPLAYFADKGATS
jgi:enoyl-CoA hydratase